MQSQLPMCIYNKRACLAVTAPSIAPFNNCNRVVWVHSLESHYPNDHTKKQMYEHFQIKNQESMDIKIQVLIKY